ncbi:MAG TPA: PepSY domain-containing protein [Aeromonadales bacterium]|nr:PepSY domain-containing protein [Aeromonadales bacterium]
MNTHHTTRQRSGKNKNGRFKLFRKWHSYLGITATIFIIILAVTGILLNHADDLELAKKPVGVPWIISVYGVLPPTNIQLFMVNDITLVSADDQLYIDNSLLKKDSAVLRGAISTAESIIAVTSDEVLLFTESGELIDTISEFNGRHVDIEALGQIGNDIFLKTRTDILQADPTLTHWHPLMENKVITWSKPVKPTAETMQQISHQYQSHILNWERVIQDIHSVRILQKSGKYLADVVAALLILLSLSGIYMWLKRKKK